MRAGLKPAGYVQAIKAVGILWWAGFKDAVSLHRCFVFFVHDNRIVKKVAQCFVLNGVIFLGSILLLQHVLKPGTHWLLHMSLHSWAPALLLNAADSLIVAVYTWLWLFPAYTISLLVNCLWYQEIAEHAFNVIQKQAVGEGHQRQKLRHAPQPLNVFIAQEVYRVLLFSVFLAQNVVVRHVPYAGRPVQFLLTSWVYAFYWFDYKWSLTNLPLENRVQFFQSHWAYFAGFGSLCIIPQLFFSFLLSEALMGMAFPLFVLMACESDPRAQYQKVAKSEAAHGRHLELGSVPVFYMAQQVTTGLIQQFDSVLAGSRHISAWLKWLCRRCTQPTVQ